MNKKKQEGAVLIIGLLLLIIVTLLGVSGVKSTVLEKNMTANAQFHMQTFQATESAIDSTIGDDSVYIESMSAGENGTTREYDVNHDAHAYEISSSTTITSAKPLPAVTYSLDAYAAYPFTIRGRSEIDGVSARTHHIQHVKKVGPKAN